MYCLMLAHPVSVAVMWISRRGPLHWKREQFIKFYDPHPICHAVIALPFLLNTRCLRLPILRISLLCYSPFALSVLCWFNRLLRHDS